MDSHSKSVYKFAKKHEAKKAALQKAKKSKGKILGSEGNSGWDDFHRAPGRVPR